ncbi:MAG: hypothetical protein KDN18_00410 [Verrucomicrobiae bacterium]|nr:hypothetical protein [Verrucomicrobiae bacterium]
MTDQQFETLVIDHSLGELSEEASALLAAWLELSPDRMAEAHRLKAATELAGEAVARRPLVQPKEEGDEYNFLVKKGWTSFFPLKLAAAFGLLLLATAAGYRAGMGPARPSESGITSVGVGDTESRSPWARYRLDRERRFAVVVPSQPRS